MGLADQRRRIQQLVSENAGLRAENQRLRECVGVDVRQLRAANIALRDENRELQNQIDTLSQDSLDLRLGRTETEAEFLVPPEPTPLNRRAIRSK